MHVASVQGAVFRQRRKFRQSVERDIQLSRRSANLEVPDPIVEFAWKIRLVHAFQERSLYVHCGYDNARREFVAVFEAHAGCFAVSNDYLVNAGFRSQFAAVSLECTSD